MGVEYRIEFTLSNISKKSVMKPVVLLVFKTKEGGLWSLYFGLEQFALLRKQIALAMKTIYSIEMRTMM